MQQSVIVYAHHCILGSQIIDNECTNDSAWDVEQTFGTSVADMGCR